MAIFILLQWSGTKPEVSQKYVCTLAKLGTYNKWLIFNLDYSYQHFHFIVILHTYIPCSLEMQFLTFYILAAC